MSTLWTPDGERPIRRDPPSGGAPPPSGTAGGAPPPPSSPPPGPEGGPPDDPELQARMAELTEQMANTPAEVIVADRAYQFFELAALHLSLQPPQLDQARIAIDAMGALVDGLKGRLGEAEQQLSDGVAQLRMAFVQIAQAATGAPEG